MLKCWDRGDAFIVRAIKNLYTPEEVRKSINGAIKSIHCIPDTIQSYNTQTTGHGKSEKTDTIFYYGANANFILLGSTIQMPRPWLVKKNERIDINYFIQQFKRSQLYAGLSKYAGLIDEDILPPAEDTLEE